MIRGEFSRLHEHSKVVAHPSWLTYPLPGEMILDSAGRWAVRVHINRSNLFIWQATPEELMRDVDINYSKGE